MASLPAWLTPAPIRQRIAVITAATPVMLIVPSSPRRALTRACWRDWPAGRPLTCALPCPADVAGHPAFAPQGKLIRVVEEVLSASDACQHRLEAAHAAHATRARTLILVIAAD